MWVPTSHPANAQRKRLIAVPIPATAVRQERLEVRGIRVREADRHHADDDDQEQGREHQLQGTRDPHTEEVDDEGRHEDGDSDPADGGVVDAEHGDDVLRAEHADDGGTDAHAEEEPVAGHARPGVAEGAACVARDAAGVGIARGQGGEGAGERDREQEHRGNGDDRGRTGDGCREPGQHQDACAEHRGDVERRAPSEAEGAVVLEGLRCSLGNR